MKPLLTIFLLLATIQFQSQDIFYETYYRDEMQNPGGIDFEMVEFKIELYELLEEFTECCLDSMMVIYGGIPQVYLSNPPQYGRTQIDTMYMESEPDLAGFLEWLEESK